jgi:hypothetical protein
MANQLQALKPVPAQTFGPCRHTECAAQTDPWPTSACRLHLRVRRYRGWISGGNGWPQDDARG